MWKEGTGMLSEIGSNFWLPQGEKTEAGIKDSLFNATFEDKVFTSSGRGAISLVLEEQNENSNRALLPSFTCESVIEPFIRHGYEVAFYSVGKTLNVDRELFLDEVRKADSDVILIHNYFGFNTTSEIRDLIPELRKEGIVVIEDITQSLYSCFGRLKADYFVGSFRKWDGIPDGGFVLKVNGKIENEPTKEDTALAEMKVAAMKAKYEYLFHNQGEKESFLKLFAEAENLLENEQGVYKMSDFSQRVQANIRIEKIKEARRRNYLHLLEKIGSSVDQLFQTLPEDVTPLYFPVVCKNRRTELQIWLRSNRIYAPVVWPKPESITGELQDADFYYDKLLCIPCDQRYGTDEMARIASAINLWNGDFS